jgi:hypothetical protein
MSDGMVAASTLLRVAASDCAKRFSRSETWRAASAPATVALPATFERSPAVLRIAATTSLSDGAGCCRTGLRAVPRPCAADLMAAIFSS